MGPFLGPSIVPVFMASLAAFLLHDHAVDVDVHLHCPRELLTASSFVLPLASKTL